jgi:heme oxygenase
MSVALEAAAGALAAGSPTILQRLRQETAQQHAALEARLPLLDGSLTRDAYRHLLGRFWGYYAPLEACLLGVMQRHALDFDYTVRQKTPLLERDLQALGVAAGSMPRCASLPALAELAQLLGCLYVIEGSTLGGRLITQRLSGHLALRADSGGAFFSGYGAATAARWHEFGLFMTATALPLGRDAMIVAGANDTFRTFAAWLLRP